MDNVQSAFELYPKEKITGIWAQHFNDLPSTNSNSSAMSKDGSDDYMQAHNDSRNLIKTTGTPIDLRVDL